MCLGSDLISVCYGLGSVIYWLRDRFRMDFYLDFNISGSCRGRLMVVFSYFGLLSLLLLALSMLCVGSVNCSAQMRFHECSCHCGHGSSYCGHWTVLNGLVLLVASALVAVR